MMAMEIVVNADKYEDKLTTSRRVGAYLSKKLGMSKNDLPPLLKSKFEQLTASQTPCLSWQVFLLLLPRQPPITQRFEIQTQNSGTLNPVYSIQYIIYIVLHSTSTVLLTTYSY